MPTDRTGRSGRLVVVTGATGATGRATCAALLAHGERVVAVGRDPESLRALAESLTADGADQADRADLAARLETRVCDLLDGDAVHALAEEVVTAYGGVDGLFHLVGGWRGGSSFTASTDDDWRWLSGNLVDTLRHTTIALHDALLASGHGRVAIISAAAAATPTAGNAAYASAKAAAETWLRAMADSFGADGATPGSAAVIGVVKWIGSGRTATSPAEVADWLVGLLDTDAAGLNGSRVDL
ncbi:SDR family NAD(P)-dependent oxidoreductase [Humibacillus xanthopallidus]|nr:SDR family NAD(P)-dependent oxidoreductase [Humibacillus xanthopallidus]